MQGPHMNATGHHHPSGMPHKFGSVPPGAMKDDRAHPPHAPMPPHGPVPPHGPRPPFPLFMDGPGGPHGGPHGGRHGRMLRGARDEA